MSSITLVAPAAQSEQSWISSFLKWLAYKEPKQAVRHVAAEPKRKHTVNLNPALAYECDNWMRWTGN